MDSDPDLVIIDKDSGMSSLTGSKDETPERHADQPITPDIPVPEPAVPEPTVPEPGVKESKPINKTVAIPGDPAENYDDEPDETISERLWALTEIFPEGVRDAVGSAVNFSSKTTKWLYQFSCNASWIFFTSSMILFAPIIFETERAQAEEMQKNQHKQLLFGPGAAGQPGAATGPGGMPALPPMPSSTHR